MHELFYLLILIFQNAATNYVTCLVPGLCCGLWGEALVDGVLGDAGVGVLLGPGLALPPRHGVQQRQDLGQRPPAGPSAAAFMISVNCATP